MRLRYTVAALADLDAALGYIAERSPQGARRVQRRIRDVIGLLKTAPFIGTRTDDPSMRRMTTTPYPYLIFYEVNGVDVIIHAVRHTARDLSGIPAGGETLD